MPASHRGTGFVGLNTYLGLNQGTARNMADGLAGDVEEKGAAFSGALGDAQARFQTQLGDAGDFGLAPDNVTAEQAAEMGGRQWKGPAGLDAGDVANLYGLASQAQNTANATGTNAGRQTLLGKKYGATAWGGGALDANLAGAGDTSGRLAGARGAYGRLVSSLNGAERSAQSAATAGRKQFEDTAAQWKARVPGLQQKERIEAGAKAAQPDASVQVGTYDSQDEEERSRYPRYP